MIFPTFFEYNYTIMLVEDWYPCSRHEEISR
jgi:hypothetical protein